MSLPREVDTFIIPQPGILNPGTGEVKVAEKSRQCPICHVYYKYGNSYWQHVRYVHASFLSQCVICEKSYKRTTMAKHHILHSHKIAWHLCSNYVRKIKKSDLSQSQEIKNEMENKNYNMKYFKKKTLHLISCFNCYDCPGSFATIDELFEHVKSHKGEENYFGDHNDEIEYDGGDDDDVVDNGDNGDNGDGNDNDDDGDDGNDNDNDVVGVNNVDNITNADDLNNIENVDYNNEIDGANDIF